MNEALRSLGVIRTQMQNHKRPYDVAVAYRICPQLSEGASSFLWGNDKYQLAEICLKSFKESLCGLRARVWVILDNCPPEYADLFSKYFEPNDLTLLRLNGVGNQATFQRQIEILLQQQDSDVVYFAEDDYVYRRGEFHCMIDLLLQHTAVHFISPYDHLDYYTMNLHREPKSLKVHGGKHWTTASSTCLTFLTRKDTLRKTKNAFYTYKRRSLDCSVWLSLTKCRVFNPFFVARHLLRDRLFSKIVLKSWLYCWRQIVFGERWNLWVPIPAVATHLDVRALSPNVDWRALIEQVNRELVEELSASKCS